MAVFSGPKASLRTSSMAGSSMDRLPVAFMYASKMATAPFGGSPKSVRFGGVSRILRAISLAARNSRSFSRISGML